MKVPTRRRNEPSYQDVKKFVESEVANLLAVLKATPETTKSALPNHLKELTLTPTVVEGKQLYAVTGAVNMAPAQERVMQVVARDGIEPPTPAFSGLLTVKAKWFRIREMQVGQELTRISDLVPVGTV